MADELEANGEPKISKAAAKKAEKKAEKAAKKAAYQAEAVLRPKKEPPKAAEPAPDEDPMDATFKVGWLKDVYDIAPVGTDVRTRFPPEPNGFLHIGHAKAIAVNFGFAKFYGGKCYLRYDDTNPAAEEEQYFDSIKESVEWLGYEPYQVTYSSDHFDQLYELAEALIKKDKAYVCHCTKEEIKQSKGGEDNKGPRYACPHRDRPIEESLEEFRAMRDGKYEAKEVVLRMKMKLLESGNPSMWDTVAYRITDPAQSYHHRTKDKWRIYPTYDFTHCLCDAFEKISHSLCTAEFRTARESYDWLIDELLEYLPAKPQQREYGRLNVTGTLLSKRKIHALVNKGIVRDWDDPRLYTLIALRRRGIPPGAIRTFVAELGVSDALTTIQTVRLETTVRKYLERTVPRLMLIPDPIPVIIDNLPADHYVPITLEFMPRSATASTPPKLTTHTVPFTNKVYIDRSDFRTVDTPDFFRLAPGKTVGLLNVPHPIRCTSFSTSPTTGAVTEIRAVSEPSPEDKPKSFIQWVAASPAHGSPVQAEVRIFNALFHSANPSDADGGFLADVNPASETVYPHAVVEVGLEEVRRTAPWPGERAGVPNLHPGPWDVRFQGMRVAYFAMDKDSGGAAAGGKVVLNKIVSLKEDAGKAA